MAIKRGITRIYCQLEFPVTSSAASKTKAALQFCQSKWEVTQSFGQVPPFLDIFSGKIFNLKQNFNPLLQMHNNAKVVVVGNYYQEHYSVPKPLVYRIDAANWMINHEGSYQIPELLVRHPGGCFLGPSALPGTNGIFVAPFKPLKVVCHNALQLKVRSHFVHPANDISCHQSQGATISRSFAALSIQIERYYGMANVVISRTPELSEFALAIKYRTER